MLTGLMPSRDATTIAAPPPALRRCLACGESKAKEELIRFVLAPDGVLTPDLAARLPGRGLWVCARREALAKAFAKNPFSRAAGAKASIPPDLLERVEELLTRRCMSLFGLAKGAGAVVPGVPRSLEAHAEGTLVRVMMAAGAGADARDKLARAPCAESGLTSSQLGQSLGRDPTAAVGLKPHALTERIKAECVRLCGVRGLDGTVATNEKNEEKADTKP